MVERDVTRQKHCLQKLNHMDIHKMIIKAILYKHADETLLTTITHEMQAILVSERVANTNVFYYKLIQKGVFVPDVTTKY